MAAGRRPAAHNRRFDVCPRHGHALYVAELDNGLVKIGCTSRPRERMKSLARYVRAEFGTDIRDFHIGEEIERRDLRHSESLFVARMCAAAVQIPGRLEYFGGTSLRLAVALLPHFTKEPAHG